MNTKPINSQNNSKNNGSKKGAAFAGAAAAGAGLGVAGTMMASQHEEPVEEKLEKPEEEVAEEKEEQAPQPAAKTGNATAGHSDNEVHPVTEQPEGPLDAELDEVQEETPAEETTEEKVEQTEEEPVTEETVTEETVVEEPVNPDDIADAIIAENQIDPNDIDMADIINFDEIGTVTDEAGEMYTAATFHDGAGNEYMMVDLDNDNTFDIILTEEGSVLVDENGAPIPTAGITVDDVELDINNDNEYLAANDDISGDDLDIDMSQDILQA